MGFIKRNALKREAGQSLPEYGLCIALISLVCITALSTMGSNLNNKLMCIAAAVAPQNSGGGFGGGGGNNC